MKSILKIILWTAIAFAGAAALAAIAFERREPLNAVWFVVAALCTYLVAYRFYSKLIPPSAWKTATISFPPANGF